MGAIGSSPMASDGLRGHHDSHPDRREEHGRACKTMASSTTRAAGVAASRRTVTGPTIRSIDAVAIGAEADRGEAMGAANSAPASSDTTSLPCRASIRQNDRWLAFNPCRGATSFTVTSGTSVSATIRPFTSSYYRRLPAGAARNSTNPTASMLRSRCPRLTSPV